MIRKIVSSQDPILKKVCKPVGVIDKKILQIIADLQNTLRVQKDPEGVAIAAPQIGKLLRIFVVSHKGLERVVVNPEILKVSRKKAGQSQIMEGCLSLPNYYGPLKRASVVKIKYLNEQGKKVEEEFEGFFTQIILHEIDHLNGIFFVQRLLEQKKPLYKLNKNNEWEEVEL